MKKLMLFFLSIVTINIVSCVDIALNCEFHTALFKETDPTYDCFIKSLTYSDADTITAVFGSHEDGKSNADVTGFVAGGSEIKNVPKNLEKLFPKLESFTLQNTSISTLSQDDFKDYKNLKVLEIFDSKIEKISGEIFKFNEKLEYVDLHGNKLKSIDSQVFQGLVNLKSLFLDRNICIDKFAIKNKEKVLKLIENVREDC